MGKASFRYWDGQTWTDRPPQPTPQEKRDNSRTAIYQLITIGMAGLFGLWSLFAMMIPADGCTPEKCNDGLISAAYLLIWIGLPVSVVGGLVGVSIAAKRKRPKSVPSRFSLIAVVACIVVWFVLMRIATPSTMW